MQGLSFYVIFAIVMAIGAYAIIPRDQFKKYFLYALVFGAIGDMIIYYLMNALGMIGYKGFDGLKIIGDYSLFTPITWLFAFMLFFYLLPVRRWFLVPYIVAWSALNYFVGMVMANLDLFWINDIYRYIQPFVFAAWYSFAAYAFRKLEKREQTKI